ncbi:MAG: alanyl-tRNA editing protein [Enterocloster asparagiformis]|nr:alanyl-tRNA editing protein [Enterocloster asparagiformis]
MDKSRLYYQLPYVKSFMCTVEECRPGTDGTWLVALNQTGFYPEGGGQPSDTGTLDGIPVRYVFEKDGRVWHQVEAPMEPGRLAEGVIDWERRYDHMQHHTGEHILSGLIHRCYGYDNVGFHMGKDEVTIDVSGPLTMEQLEELEDEANRLIYDNVPVEEHFPTPRELASMDYRSKKELTGDVRIINIPGGDTCACCGTHVTNTGEVGIIKVTGMIHYKGGVRVSILCGRKALLDYRRRVNVDTRISNLLSAKPQSIGEAVEKLKADGQEKDAVIGGLYQKLFAFRAQACPESDEPLLCFEEGLTPVRVRQLCTLLYEQGKGGVVLVCSGSDEKQEYAYALGSGRADMRTLSRALNGLLAGRGGGSALMAQGTFRADAGAIRQAFLAEAEKLSVEE